jgi:hypothetical protein
MLVSAVVLIALVALVLVRGESLWIFGVRRTCPNCSGEMGIAGAGATETVYCCPDCGREMRGFRDCSGRY